MVCMFHENDDVTAVTMRVTRGHIGWNCATPIVECCVPDSQSNTIDFRLVSRLPTSSNSTIALKPAALKPVAPAAPKPAAPKPAVPKPAAPKPAAPKPASKLVAPKSTVSESARKQVAPKSGSEPAHKQAMPVAKESPICKGTCYRSDPRYA